MTPYITATIVIYVFGLLTFILMIVYFYNQYKEIKKIQHNKKIEYITHCPDYWQNIGEHKCKNTFKLGKCALDDNTIMDFNDKVFQNINTGNYAKCKWSKGCNVFWGDIDRLC